MGFPCGLGFRLGRCGGGSGRGRRDRSRCGDLRRERSGRRLNALAEPDPAGEQRDDGRRCDELPLRPAHAEHGDDQRPGARREQASARLRCDDGHDHDERAREPADATPSRRSADRHRDEDRQRSARENRDRVRVLRPAAVAPRCSGRRRNRRGVVVVDDDAEAEQPDGDRAGAEPLEEPRARRGVPVGSRRDRRAEHEKHGKRDGALERQPRRDRPGRRQERDAEEACRERAEPQQAARRQAARRPVALHGQDEGRAAEDEEDHPARVEAVVLDARVPPRAGRERDDHAGETERHSPFRKGAAQRHRHEDTVAPS